MGAEYSIEADPTRDIVRIRMSGFFTDDDIAGFLAAREKAHARLTCGPNQHLTLNDLRGMKIQAQDIVDAFRGMLSDSAYRSKRLAFVVSPTLARSQLTRAIAGRDARFFESIAAAEAWLFTGAEGAQAA
jgi:hypothetical protein